jgi:hypothetical protein
MILLTPPQPLIEVCATLPDFRRRRGQRHPLPAMLSLACGAVLCGDRRESAMAAWGRHDGARLAPALGLTHETPCAATRPTVFRPLDREAVETQVGLGAERIVARPPMAPEAGQAAVALDGTTRRGSRQQGAPGGPGWSALSPPLGLTLAPQAVDDKTQAVPQVETMGRPRVLTGRGLTRDALLTPRHGAQTLVDAGGDDVLIVKDHPPRRRAAIALVLTLPPGGDRQETARTIDLGHGRSEPRHRTTREALGGDSDWPGLAQVCAIGRHVITQKTGEERVAGVYGGTSGRPERVTPGPLLALVRGHGQIEPKSHGVRAVTFDDDRSQVRCGHMPHIMAALRHTAIGLLRGAGYANIAAACRQMAAQPAQALALLGIELEN